jgi:hypothetical protein
MFIGLILCYFFSSSVLANEILWRKYLSAIKEGPNYISYSHQCSMEKKDDFTQGCPDLLPEFYRARNMLFSIHENPEKHGLNEFADMKSFDREVGKYQKITNDILNTCLENEFRKCFPKIKDSIELSTLNKLFENLKADPVQRMSYPGAQCHSRAQDLAIRLAEQGYNSKIIHIKGAPTLIAPILDSKDRYSDQFIDYGGSHYVIVVTGSDGKEYILDPQFSTKPMLKKEYFKSTIGQPCTSGEITNIWECNYTVVNSTYNIPFTNMLRVEKSRSQYEKNGDQLEDFLKGKGKGISCGVFDRLTEGSVKSMVGESRKYEEGPVVNNRIRMKIIIASYEKLYQDRISLNKDKYFESGLKESFQDYEKQISNYSNVIKKVCSENEISYEECLRYRKDYKNILKNRNH